MPVFRAGAGTRPGGRGTCSLLRQRKVPKRKATPSATPSLCEGANLRRGGCGGRRRTHCAASQLRSDNCGESVHEAWALRRPCHPTTAPPQAQPAGGWAVEHPTAEQPSSRTGLCCARPHLVGASASRCAGWAECSDGPCGCPIRGFPSVCAWCARRRVGGGGGARGGRVRPPPPRRPPPGGPPGGGGGGRRQQGRPFFGDF